MDVGPDVYGEVQLGMPGGRVLGLAGGLGGALWTASAMTQKAPGEPETGGVERVERADRLP